MPLLSKGKGNNLKKLAFFWGLGASAFLLSSCGVHSVNHDPQALASSPAQFSVAGDEHAALPGRWYDSFHDARLQDLIAVALENNYDVKQALARLKQADALARQAQSVRLPAINLEASSAKDWIDGDAQQGYSRAGGALSWELDVFNRLGAAAESARFERAAFAEDIEAVRLSLSAAVAEAYYGAIAQHIRIGLLQDQSGTDNRLLKLLQQRFDEGVGTNLDVLQQRSQVALNQSLIPPAEAALRVQENRLDVLTGNAPDALDRTGPEDRFAEIGILPPLGVPSDLLLNRPDLRAIRNRLIAADADIGAAMADRLPRITLTGTYLYADGPAAAGPAAGLLAGLVQPLLDWGRRKAEVERNKAVYEEGLAAFTQAYLEAIESVENALYQENRQREYVRRLEERRRILDQSLTASQDIYKQGLSDYLPVLDAVQSLRAVERDLVTERLNLILFRIRLFRALGAPIGPETPAPAAATESPAP